MKKIIFFTAISIFAYLVIINPPTLFFFIANLTILLMYFSALLSAVWIVKQNYYQAKEKPFEKPYWLLATLICILMGLMPVIGLYLASSLNNITFSEIFETNLPLVFTMYGWKGFEIFSFFIPICSFLMIYDIENNRGWITVQYPPQLHMVDTERAKNSFD